ncbi:MAG: zinc ABC transporter substrate-binding protein [Gammaproteobacteria bacterium]|nr:zinc ABC transporter substrate-binding protein [Gammaproteobacteria bacterium]MDX2486659.1 zinc ABC transporter substrate-binding protein [Gammaproteobacteria bacterium]
MVKYFTVFALSAVFFLSLPATAAMRVFACEPEWAALVKELAGDHVKVDSATRPSQDPHYVQARPSLISKIRRADLLICTGADLEAGWLPLLQRKGSNKRILAGQPGHLMIADSIQLKDKPATLDRSGGDVHAAGNPHLQTDPRNMLPAAEAIMQRLSLLDSENAELYRQNLAEFTVRWQGAIAAWEQKAAPLRGMPVVVYHRSWVYLQDWLGLEEVASLEPKPGVPPGSSYLANVLDRTKGLSGLLIIHSQYQESKAINWFSSQSGAPVVLLPSTVGGTAEAEDLFSWYEDIVTRLLKAQGG